MNIRNLFKRKTIQEVCKEQREANPIYYEVYDAFEKINTKQELFDLAKKYDLIIKLNFYQGSIENGTSESVIIRLYDNYPNSINIWSKQIFYNTKDYRVQNIDGVKMLVKYNTNNWK